MVTFLFLAYFAFGLFFSLALPVGLTIFLYYGIKRLRSKKD